MSIEVVFYCGCKFQKGYFITETAKLLAATGGYGLSGPSMVEVRARWAFEAAEAMWVELVRRTALENDKEPTP